MFGLFEDPFFYDQHNLMNFLLDDYFDNKKCIENKESKDNKKCSKELCKQNSSAMFSWTPRSDIHETDKEFIIDAELPGVPKENVSLEVKDGVLTLKGTKESRKEEQSPNDTDVDMNGADKQSNDKQSGEKKQSGKHIWHRIERSYGSFTRSFVLPEGVATDKISAAFKDGILTVTIPKPEPVKPVVHSITIQ